MIDDPRGRIDYDEAGDGDRVVLVPGSCSTGAAWRPVVAAIGPGFRTVNTSLLGYGATDERRTAADPDIAHEAAALETVIRRAGEPAHLVGHSFGGLVSLAVALRRRVSLASLVIVEAPALEILSRPGEEVHYAAIRRMTAAYFAAFDRGERDAIAAMVDFYGGTGTFASWPERVRAYAERTTAVNVVDWATAFGFPLPAETVASVDVPSLVMWGGASHPSMQRANALLAAGIPGAASAVVEGAAHFMISTHAGEVGRLIERHIRR
ncbi:MAG: alpha/beta fold hydrolase [Alphaproteobacteria bacterium]